MAQNRQNNHTVDPNSIRVISRPTSIARKGTNNVPEVRKTLSFLGGFENAAYNTKIKQLQETQFLGFRSTLSLSGPHCSKADLSPQRSQATRLWGGRTQEVFPALPRAGLAAEPATHARLGKRPLPPLPLQLLSHPGSTAFLLQQGKGLA